METGAKVCYKTSAAADSHLLVITFLSFAMMRLAGSDAVLQKMENTGMALSAEVMEKARMELL